MPRPRCNLHELDANRISCELVRHLRGHRAQQALRPEEMFAYVLTIGMLGVALNTAFRFLSLRATVCMEIVLTTIELRASALRRT